MKLLVLLVSEIKRSWPYRSVSKVKGTAGNDASKRFLGTINKLQSKKKCWAVSIANSTAAKSTRDNIYSI